MRLILLKKLISRFLGRHKPLFVEWVSAVKSFNLHARYSFNEGVPEKDVEQLRYYIVKHCHILEKGLALPSPRIGFGQPKIKDLIKRTKEYEARGGEDVGGMVRDTLRKYREFHIGKEAAFEAGVIHEIEHFIGDLEIYQRGGVKNLERKQWDAWSIEKYNELVSFRHSVRDFDKSAVDGGLLQSVISVGVKAPSVCNRQGWFVHYYDDKALIARILSYQNGNAGFTDSIDKLLLITGNIKGFTRHEHNQLFVDGGLVSMNIMLAIHAAGLGACPLNTCMPHSKERELIKVAGIPEYERLIMMVAVGNLKESFSVAYSEKYALDRVMIKH